jgi:nicotinamide-nucleotide amidase
MQASIIAIGSEMLGPTRLDTNSLKITAILESFGISLLRKSIVGDRLEHLVAEIRNAPGDLLIVTGGLGPTEDDLTREALCEAFGLTLETDQSIADWIAARFAERGLRMPDVNRRQASVFPGQTTLRNQRGTAPGFHIRAAGKEVWVFPGVPHELEWMLATYFTPWLESVSGGRRRLRRVLKIAGMTESGVEEKLKPFYERHPGELVTILASGGQIEIHLGDESPDAIATREAEIAQIFGARLFGFDDDTLESVIGGLLSKRGETLATAESCTGGLLGSRITDIPGSSAYYLGGTVCYTAAAKTALAGVDPELIRANGEVSEPVAIALARGVRERFASSWGVGITGVAGPGGGSDEKPVGTVHIAVSGPDGDHHRKLFWPASRTMVKAFSTQAALDFLRRQLLG